MCTDLQHLAHAGTDSEPVGSNSGGNGLPPMPNMETIDGPNLAAAAGGYLDGYHHRHLFRA